MHDISHSAFSHVIDYLRGDPHGQGGQDKAHGAFIERHHEIRELLQAAGLDYKIVSDLGQYKLLDRDLPDLCADRLDYFFRDSICFNRLTPGEAQNLLKHIVLTGDFLVINDPAIACFMAKHSIIMTFACWGPPYGVLIYQRTVAALRRALEIGLITEDDFWTTDQEVWDKLRSASDEVILSAVSDVENIRQLKLCHDDKDYEYHGRDKFRAIDPLVFLDNKLQRVSEIFPDLADLLQTEKQRYERGYYIKIIR